MKYTITAGCIVFFLLIQLSLHAQGSQYPDGNVITIESALGRALENNPRLKAAELESKAGLYEAEQLKAYPNPEIEAEVENFLGSKEFTGLDGSEVTLAASQTIVLGGKNEKLYREGLVNKDLASISYLIARQQLTEEVKKAFYEALALQKQIDRTDTLIRLASSFAENLNKRVTAGRISEAELSRANIETELLRLKQSELKTSYYSSLSELKTLMGIELSGTIYVSGNLQFAGPLPKKEILAEGLGKNPAILFASSEIKLQEARTRIEESISVPDLNLTLGVKRDNGSGSEAFVVGAGIPLPLFNKNKNNIEASKVRTKIKTELLEAEKRNINLQFNFLYQKAESYINRIKSLKEDILPKAREAYSVIEKGSAMGRYSILEVLDAQKSLFEIETALTENYGELNLIIAELESLAQMEIKKER